MKIFALDTNVLSYILKDNKNAIEMFQNELNQGNKFVMLSSSSAYPPR